MQILRVTGLKSKLLFTFILKRLLLVTLCIYVLLYIQQSSLLIECPNITNISFVHYYNTNTVSEILSLLFAKSTAVPHICRKYKLKMLCAVWSQFIVPNS